MTTDNCREAFEAWINGWSGPRTVTELLGDRYVRTWVEDYWQGWRAAWKESPPPVTREGWLTEEEIALWGAPNDEGEAMRRMARAALRLYAERAALFTQLKAAIETVERGNV